jgi:ribosomal protein L37AE/L43A
MKDKNLPRFDMVEKARKQPWYLTLLAWAIAFPTVWSRKLKVNKVNMKGLKPPYILLCTHHAFVDFSVTTAAIFPHRANYIVAIDGFIKREGLLRAVGAICKRKFTNDIVLIKQIQHGLKVNKNIVAIYPEARYTLVGTTAILPDSLGKLCKMMKVPVAVLNMHGDYLSQPVWNLNKRKVTLEADLTQIVTQDEILTLDVNELNSRINKAFEYDEYRFQRDTKRKITFKQRAEGLHRVLYQCPHCMTEHEMDSLGTKLWCNHCHATYEMDEYGVLKNINGNTIFSHIPDWYEFERQFVKNQILKGEYRFEDDVAVDSLPNSDGYVRLGIGHLVHDQNGFKLTGNFDGDEFLLEKEPLSMYSAHIEYDYLGKFGDCVDLSTLNDTYYLYPQNKKNVVTKIHFATEEIYKIVQNEKIDRIRIGEVK